MVTVRLNMAWGPPAAIFSHFPRAEVVGCAPTMPWEVPLSVRRLLVFLLAALAFPQTEARAADWMRLRTANFTIEGDVGANGLKTVALRLEQFREAIRQTFPSAKLVTPAPVTVIVFAHDRDFKAVAPRFQGKPVELAGLATTSSIGSSIAICLERPDQAYPVIYHEFGHLLINNAARGLPLWLQEGLAEFYRMFDLSEDGRSAVLGKPVDPEEIGRMRDRLLPMSELLAADHESKLYNVSADRDLFYAQSWVLVHYLLLGNTERSRQFSGFLQRLGTGVPTARAFSDSFPDADKLEGELTAYVSKFTIRVVRVTFTDRVTGAVDYTMTRMTPAEAQASVGLELVRQGRYDEARVPLEWAMAHGPESASANTGTGLYYLLQGRTADGLRALRKGAELAEGDALAHFAFGYGALQCTTVECLGPQGGGDTARRELQRAVDLLPQFPEALALLGWVEATNGGDVTSAEHHFLQAIAFLPGREDYRLNLAQIYLRQEKEAKVQEMLGPIAAVSPSSANKAKAREMLGALARLRAAREERLAAQPVDSAPPAAGGGPPAASSAETGTREAEVTPIYRVIGERERRARGELSAIECTQGAIVVVIRDAVGTHRFWTPSLDRIDFITYRDDLRGNVSCGRQPGAMQVYLTWRAPSAGEPALPAGIEGRVVAIEYLPKGK
jgi:Flp pilus assembly protein TadD